jgi:hypothetical protein
VQTRIVRAWQRLLENTPAPQAILCDQEALVQVVDEFETMQFDVLIAGKVKSVHKHLRRTARRPPPPTCFWFCVALALFFQQ